MLGDLLPIIMQEAAPVIEERIGGGGTSARRREYDRRPQLIRLRRLLDDEEILITMRSSWQPIRALGSYPKFTKIFPINNGMDLLQLEKIRYQFRYKSRHPKRFRRMLNSKRDCGILKVY